MTLAASILLLDRHRVFFKNIVESMRGQGDLLRHTSTVLIRSVSRLTITLACTYFMSILLYGVAAELAFGLTTIWSALFFSFLFLISLLLLSLLPR
jgi:hypothetical protein